MKKTGVTFLALAFALGCGQNSAPFEATECCACSDTDIDGDGDGGEGIPPASELYGEDGIGSSCECEAGEGEVCKFLGVPVPTGGTEIGCDSVPSPKYFPGGRLACLTSFEKSPNAELHLYFANGYCTLYAAKCAGTGDRDVVDQLLCANATTGDFDSFESCPPGSALISGVKPITGRGVFSDTQGEITYKMCAPLCQVHSDCRGDETDPVWGGQAGYQCVLKDGIRFCTDPRNFEDDPRGVAAVTVQAF